VVKTSKPLTETSALSVFSCPTRIYFLKTVGATFLPLLSQKNGVRVGMPEKSIDSIKVILL